MKALKILGAVLFLLIAIIGVTLAVGIPGGFITGAIEQRVEKETGYQVDINGGATIRLWPLTVLTLNDVIAYDPADRELSQRLRIESIRAELSLRSLLIGSPRIREINIVRPIASLPMARERKRQPASANRAAINLSSDQIPVTIDRIVVSDATLVFKDTRNRFEDRVEKINVKAIASPGRKLDVTVDGRSREQLFKLEAKATVPAGPLDGLTVPVDFKLDAPGLLPQAISAAGEVKLNGTTVNINSLTGMLGQARFSGYASVEAATKPLVKVNLDFKQLDIDTPSSISSKPAASRSPEAPGWNDEPIKLDGLNYIDADIKISAAQLNIGAFSLAPAKIEGALASGILKMALSELGLYDGQAAAGLAIDASIPVPIYALRADLRDVRALPLMTGIANFKSLDGRMQTQLDVRTSGRTQRELVSNLSGTTNVDFKDGQIRGINIAQMIRSLTSSTLSGWQDDGAQTTDLTDLHASFRIENGKAETNDFRLAGPLVRVTGAGAVDLSTKTIAFRVEPKLVMTTQGQSSLMPDPIGLGIPVVIEGPWSAPRIYPDMSGILENPDAAFAKLREMGQGLFGPGVLGNPGTGQPGMGGNKIIDSLGTIIQGLGQSGSSGQAGAAAPLAQPAQPAQPPPPGAQPSQPGSLPAQPAQKEIQIDSIIKQLFGR